MYSMLFTATIVNCKFIYFVLYAFIYHNTRTNILKLGIRN